MDCTVSVASLYLLWFDAPGKLQPQGTGRRGSGKTRHVLALQTQTHKVYTCMSVVVSKQRQIHSWVNAKILQKESLEQLLNNWLVEAQKVNIYTTRLHCWLFSDWSRNRSTHSDAAEGKWKTIQYRYRVSIERQFNCPEWNLKKGFYWSVPSWDIFTWSGIFSNTASSWKQKSELFKFGTKTRSSEARCVQVSRVLSPWSFWKYLCSPPLLRLVFWNA